MTTATPATPAASVKEADGARFSRHLNEVFEPLEFPPELSQRILTHGSHKLASQGHSGKLNHLGRRVLQTYLQLFLQQSKALRPEHDLDEITSQTLNTYLLGTHVAPLWRLERVLRWSPAIQAPSFLRNGRTDKTTEKQNEMIDAWIAKTKSLDPQMKSKIGLHKVMGFTAEAVVGGIFHQFVSKIST